MRIIYLISHGHTARGAFQTNLLSKLAEAGIDVVVVAKNDKEGELKKQVEQAKGTLDFYSPPTNRNFIQQSILRAYVHQDIKKNPALWEKHQRRAIDQSASVFRKFINRFYLVAGACIRANRTFKNAYARWELRSYYDNQAVQILEKHKPDAIISTRPVDSMEAVMLNAARHLNITRIMYILSWDNITAKGIFPEQAEFYLTWGPIMNKELKTYYKAKEEQLYLTGVTHFDVHHHTQENPNVGQWLNTLGLDATCPYLFFTMSASYYCPNEIDIIEWLAKKIEDNAFGENMQLILRPHMHNFQEGLSDLTWKNRLLSLQSDRIAIDFPEIDNSLLTWYMKEQDMLRLSNLLLGASICLNSGSTVAIEAAILDRPTILTLFDTEEWPAWRSVKRIKEYIHLKKFIATGAVQVSESFEDLESSITAYLKNTALDREERKEAVAQECYLADGKATERFVNHIKNILDHN